MDLPPNRAASVNKQTKADYFPEKNLTRFNSTATFNTVIHFHSPLSLTELQIQDTTPIEKKLIALSNVAWTYAKFVQCWNGTAGLVRHYSFKKSSVLLCSFNNPFHQFKALSNFSSRPKLMQEKIVSFVLSLWFLVIWEMCGMVVCLNILYLRELQWDGRFVLLLPSHV